MATYYVSTSGDDNNAGTAAAPFRHLPSSDLDRDVEVASTAKAVTLSSGDIIKIKRGDKFPLSGFLFIYQLSGITLTTYYNSDGSDDPTQPRPIFFDGYSRATWTSHGTLTNVYYNNVGSACYGTIMGSNIEDVYYYKNFDELIYSDFTGPDGNSEYWIDYTEKPDFVFKITNYNSALTEGTVGTLAAAEWGWDSGNSRVYVKDAPSNSVLYGCIKLSERTPYYYEANGLNYNYVYEAGGNPTSVYDFVYVINRNDLDTRTGATTYRRSSRMLVIRNSDNITIDGLDFRYGESEDIYIVNEIGDTGTKNITINNCRSGSDGAGIYIDNNNTSYQVSDVSITNNIFNREIIYKKSMNLHGSTNAEPGGNALHIVGGTLNSYIANNKFSSWGHDCISIQVAASDMDFHNCIVEYNEGINGESNYCRFIGAASAPTGKLTDWHVRYNLDLCNQKNKMQGTRSKWYNNIFWKHNSSNSDMFGEIETLSQVPIQFQADTNLVVEDCELFNNVIYNCNMNAVTVVAQSGQIPGSNKIYNNILYKTGIDTTEGNTDRIVFRLQGDAAGTWDDNQYIFNNLIYDYFDNGSQDIIVESVDGYPSSILRTNAEAETKWSNWYNNIIADPLLDDNFFPASTSPCLNAGAIPLSKYDAYNRPNWGNHIGAVWPRINTSKTRRSF